MESFCAELQLLHKILCLKDLCSSPDSSELFLSLSTPSFVFTNVHFFPVFICDPKITFAYWADTVSRISPWHRLIEARFLKAWYFPTLVTGSSGQWWFSGWRVEGRKPACLIYNLFGMEYLCGHYSLDSSSFYLFIYLFSKDKSCLVTEFFPMQFAYVRVGSYGTVKQECIAIRDKRKILNLVSLLIKSLLWRLEISNDMYFLLIHHYRFS